ncbi:hypothetical protein D9601_15405 [Sphingomonas sp. MA1305]|uniref:hypothetical protein n=1 Tax=Sphingomonas sp. MA1305 TaxID=2479204 RepID=UPI0018E038A3|nr:hypothetical protein [Sphingomonas sp. MA1305]MBI0476736.1 hypothetical protein [Sphingomonas sp. MA1305]
MRAALSYANEQFLAGDYPEALRTIRMSRSRNDHFAAQFPYEVSDLARASSVLSSYDGRIMASRIDARSATDALRAGLKATDPIIQVQRLETADRMLLNDGGDPVVRLNMALAIYDEVAAKARQLGNVPVEGHALFRKASVLTEVARDQPLYKDRALRAIAALRDHDGAAFAPFRSAGLMLQARIAARSGKGEAARQLLMTLPADERRSPLLVDEPFLDLTGYQLQGSTIDDRPQWADVGFWVRPDGSVDDVEVVQRSAAEPGAWLRAKMANVAKRTYAPLPVGADSPGVYRVERYSMIFDRTPGFGRVPIRSDAGRLMTMDVTTVRPGGLGDATVPVS